MFVYFFKFCTSTSTAEGLGLKGRIEMGKDECKIDFLSCFEMEHLFLKLEESKLLRDFSANFAYIFFKF